MTTTTQKTRSTKNSDSQYQQQQPQQVTDTKLRKKYNSSCAIRLDIKRKHQAGQQGIATFR
jgi:hypothetical protein